MPDITKQKLSQLYWLENKSTRQIGKMFNCDHSTILRYMKKLNVSSRNHKEAARFVDSCFKPREINLYPTQSVGYLCGLILGDGFIIKTKRRNYWICLETTKLDFRDFFKEAVKVAFPNLHCYLSERVKKRKFPNGSVRTNLTYLVRVDSKQLYQALCPYKRKDHHWTVPRFLSTKKSKIGFLKGIYDAEGGVAKKFINNKGNGTIGLGSKHKQNLIPVAKLLKNLDIESRMYKDKASNCYRLCIIRKKSKILFKKLINFRLEHKRKALEADLKHLELQTTLF